MIFVFLPTALMYCLSLALFISVSAAYFINPYADLILLITLIVASVVTAFCSRLSAVSLYRDELRIFSPNDYYRWFDRQKRIAKRSIGSYKIAVKLNAAKIAIVCEHTDDAARLLSEIKPKIEKMNRAYFNYAYLSAVLKLKEKRHDLSRTNELLEAMYMNICAPGFGNRDTVSKAAADFEYARLEIEFYKQTPASLASSNKELIDRFRLSARLPLDDYFEEDAEGLYQSMSRCYNIGLCYAVSGDYYSAEKHFSSIASSDSGYPFVDRARRFLLSRDIDILMETMP